MRQRGFSVIAVLLSGGCMLLPGCSVPDSSTAPPIVASGGAMAADTDAHCEPAFYSGALSDSVQVNGTSAQSLQLRSNRQVSALNTQRTVVARAEQPGALVTEGSIVAVNVASADSATGAILDVHENFGTDRASTLLLVDSNAEAAAAALLCAAVGDTVAVAFPAAESRMMGLAGSLIAVIEIHDVYGDRAVGKRRALPAGFPAVTTDESGRPGVILPPQQAPTTTRTATRIAGEGKRVTAEQTVIAQVLTVGWNGFEQTNSWTSGPLSLGTEAAAGSSLREHLTGHSVGSQLVVIEPGEGSPKVSVVDLLAVV